MKLVFDFAASQITIEGDGPELVAALQAARDVAPMISEIKLLTNGSAAPKKPSGMEAGGERESDRNHVGNGGGKGWKTMREFTRSLALSAITERITAIAFYAKRYEGKNGFTAKDMDGWFTLCGFEKPASMNVALSDTKRRSANVESSGYGEWKLSTNGENLITRKLEEAGEKQGG